MKENESVIKTPLLTVLLATYNHEKYISRAIDSILMQETDFFFDVLIGEECSTDSTRDIINSYASKYPNKISIIERKQNVGMHENLNSLVQNCKDKYVARLEGDDYWTDNKKLQKQVDFLELNPDFVCCAHNTHIVDEYDIIREDMPDRFWDNYVFTIKEFGGGNGL